MFSWNLYDPVKEYRRLGLLKKGKYPFRCSKLNSDGQDEFKLESKGEFKYSPTYPRCFITPWGIKDADLIKVCGHRSKARLPAVVFMHARTGATLTRCAQPKSGILGKRCAEDEKLFQHLRHLLSFSVIVNSHST